MSEHNYKYFREQYGVPARKNAPVKFKGRLGKVIGTRGPYLKIKFDDERRATGAVYHPTWEIEWQEAKAFFSIESLSDKGGDV